ncbi:MAG: cation transporter [Cyanobacteria bacterium P01_F01_bin.53]
MRKNTSNLFELETQALRLTAIGTLALALFGLGVAVITKSEVILLDGFFLLIRFAIALLTQKMVDLAMRPRNERYPFGYATFEPMLNLSKGLLLGLVSLFALMSAISALFTGGRNIVVDVVIGYAGVATVACFWLAWRVGKLAKQSQSSIVAVDAQRWILDGIISVVVTITFLGLQFTQGTSLEAMTPYADSILVILLVFSTISMPIKIIRDAWRQIVGYCPDHTKTIAIESFTAMVFKDIEALSWQVRSLEVGRFLYVQVYVWVPNQWCETIAQQDQLRHQLYALLIQRFTKVQLDIIFTEQVKWLD